MLVFVYNQKKAGSVSADTVPQVTKLPQPAKKGAMSLEEAIQKRRSMRAYKNQALTKEQVSQILWAAQGITDPDGKKRAAPSAMAMYPLEIYAVCPEAAYHYIPKDHAVEKVGDGDLRKSLGGQKTSSEAAMVIVITAVPTLFSSRVDENNKMKFIYLEAGHCAQNILLQAVALGLAGVPMAGYSEESISKALSLPADRKPIYIISVGYPQ
ncbi:hypothetical protein AUJ67_02805 [Candidatus Desantisbacteria bacterium CG1_02_49_89]|nr:MAG: hypothetical protein AUJ67_02805 [Candidatus Desantisbacteria bacterium CG1_02_49_89]